MAAFSSQNHHPFLVDASFLMEQPAVVPPSHFHPTQLLQETSFNGTSYHETISDSEPSFVTKNQSPETSMVVDKVEIRDQVTQKVTTMIKKRRNKIASSFSCPQSSKDTAEGRKKKQKKNNDGVKEVKKKKEDNKGSEESPAGYIHVRARRGQATDSHSLAERVRREKISERMKMLQRLVPGCDKVTGKALVLDEIINYVQSLQYQVEFLSMKLASVNPMVYDFTGELDALMIEPEHCGGMASALPTLPQCSPSQATTLFDTTTVTTTTTSFPTGRANIDYLMVDSASFLQQEQQSNFFSEDSGNHNLFWDVEEQRQKFASPYGFSNDSCSLD